MVSGSVGPLYNTNTPFKLIYQSITLFTIKKFFLYSSALFDSVGVFLYEVFPGGFAS